MLILSQKRKERIEIDGPCVIELTEIRGNRIKLGFTGPKTTRIHRTGVAGAIKPNEHQEEKAA